MLDASLSAQSKEQASANVQASSPVAQKDQLFKSQWIVMSKSKETTTVMTLLGDVHSLTEHQKTEDCPNVVHEDEKDENEVEVNYEADSPEESDESALRAETMAREQQALGIEPTRALVQELSSRHEVENAEGKDTGAEDASDSALSIASDLIMRERPEAGSPAANNAKPVLNARDIMSIVKRKDISIKTPVYNHNPQRQGLEDNLFDFGDALCDYTSDDGTIRINQGLATLMLIAATAEARNRLLMERKKEAFEQVTAQAQSM